MRPAGGNINHLNPIPLLDTDPTLNDNALQPVARELVEGLKQIYDEQSSVCNTAAKSQFCSRVSTFLEWLDMPRNKVVSELLHQVPSDTTLLLGTSSPSQNIETRLEKRDWPRCGAADAARRRAVSSLRRAREQLAA